MGEYQSCNVKPTPSLKVELGTKYMDSITACHKVTPNITNLLLSGWFCRSGPKCHGFL